MQVHTLNPKIFFVRNKDLKKKIYNNWNYITKIHNRCLNLTYLKNEQCNSKWQHWNLKESDAWDDQGKEGSATNRTTFWTEEPARKKPKRKDCGENKRNWRLFCPLHYTKQKQCKKRKRKKCWKIFKMYIVYVCLAMATPVTDIMETVRKHKCPYAHFRYYSQRTALKLRSMLKFHRAYAYRAFKKYLYIVTTDVRCHMSCLHANSYVMTLCCEETLSL